VRTPCRTSLVSVFSKNQAGKMPNFVDSILLLHVVTEAIAVVFVLMRLDPKLEEYYVDCAEKTNPLILLFVIQGIGTTLLLGILGLISKPRSKVALCGICFYHVSVAVCYFPSLLTGEKFFGISEPWVAVVFHLPMGVLFSLPLLGVVCSDDGSPKTKSA